MGMQRSDRAHQGGGQGERMPAPAYQDWVTLTGLGECTGESRRETSHRRAREDMGQAGRCQSFQVPGFWRKLMQVKKDHKETQAHASPRSQHFGTQPPHLQCNLRLPYDVFLPFQAHRRRPCLRIHVRKILSSVTYTPPAVCSQREG